MFDKIIDFWFFNLRKMDDYHYDSDTEKYYNHPKSPKQIFKKTWDGDYDILNIMQLKIEQMIYNLKKYGVHTDLYIFTDEILKYGSRNDWLYCFWKLFYLQDQKEYDANDSFGTEHIETWTNIHGLDARTKKSLFYRYKNYVNYIFLGNYKTEKIFIKHQFTQINGDHYSIISRLEDNSEYLIEGLTKNFTFDEIQKIIDDQLDGFNVLEEVIKNQIIVEFDEFSLNRISTELKKYFHGNYITIKELLELRHKIKKLKNLSETDDKYYNMWKDIEDNEEANKMIRKSTDVYRNDRKQLYNEICTLMSEKGDCWWD